MIIPAKKELTLQFNIEKVKQCINQIISTKPGRFQVFDKNNVFNTYCFASMSKYAGIINVTLTKTDDEKTLALFEATPMVGSYQDIATLTTILDEFLQILSKALTGEPVTEQFIAANTKGCLSSIIFLLFVSVAVLISCNKGSNNSPTVADGTLQYKINDTLVTMQNVNVGAGQYVIFSKQLQGSFFQNASYRLEAQTGVNNAIAFAIGTDSLKAQNYVVDTSTLRLTGLPTTLVFMANISTLYYSSDYLKINITSYTNGFISGSFSGKLSPLPLSFDTRGTTIITDGVFRNIKCVY